MFTLIDIIGYVILFNALYGNGEKIKALQNHFRAIINSCFWSGLFYIFEISLHC